MSEAFRRIDAADGIEELELAANGLRVLLVPEPEVPVATVCVVYHVGSRNEAVGHTGATHLLEHLMFKGSRRFDPRRGRPIARSLEQVGAAYNATTWFDRTTYYETVPPEHLELALELESDRMRHALLRAEDLASETTVVRNEFERGENEPFEALLRDAFATAFREHPYHHPTIGWRDDIENVTVERLRGFYDTFYHPDNATLILAGAVEREAALAQVGRWFAPLPRAAAAIPNVHTQEPPQQGERRFVIRRAGEVGWVATSWRTPAAAHADTHALAVLADSLASGVTSRLYQSLVDGGRCLDVQAVAWQLRDPGLFQVFACLDDADSHAAVEAAIRAEVAGLAAAGLGPDELERAKVQVEAQTAYLRDAPSQVAAALAEAVACADWRFYLTYAERIRAVTNEDVVRVARTYLDDDALTVGWFAPRPGNGAAASAGPGPRPCHYRTRVAEHVVEHRLGGGLHLAVLPRRHNPTVTVHGSLLAGHGMVAPERWTGASLIPDMLERGAGPRDRLQFARTVEDRGIELDISADTFSPLEVQVQGRCLTRHLPLLVELLFDQLRSPAFPADELDKLRQLRLGELAQAQEDTFVRAYEALSRRLYPAGHPHHRRGLGERRTDLERAARETLVELHGELYGPASLILAVVGDCGPEQAVELVERAAAGWHGGRAAPPEVARRLPDAAAAGTERVAMADKPSLDVLLGHCGGLRRRDQDFLASMLGNAILGQSTLTSRLGRRLRDAEGLTYGVISRFMGASLVDGPWLTSFTVPAAAVEPAVRAAREEIERLVEHGPEAEELAVEQAAMAGSYRVGLATSAGLARELSRLARHGLEIGEIDRLPERILAVTAAEVAAALRGHLDPSRLSVVVAGELGPSGNGAPALTPRGGRG